MAERITITLECPAIRPNLAALLKALLRRHDCKCVDYTVENRHAANAGARKGIGTASDAPEAPECEPAATARIPLAASRRAELAAIELGPSKASPSKAPLYPRRVHGMERNSREMRR